jgi:hypothetical protein
MSRHGSWFPPEVPIHTGRLCSTGSGCHPVPRRPRSYAALRRPAPISPGSGSPCRWLTSLRVLVLCPLGRRHVPPPPCRASETGHRLSARPAWIEERRGPPRLRGHPLRACSGRTPRRRRSPLRPSVVGERCCLRWHPALSASGKTEVAGPRSHGPHVRLPTHRRPCLHDRRKAGYRLGRAHPWPGRIRTCWTTNKVS